MITGTLDTADVAKLIRKRLGVRFPLARFNVHTKRFAGGSEVSIRWTDGPRGKDVEAEVKPFEGKGFDGSIDLAYSNEIWLLPDGSAQFAATRGTEGSGGTVREQVTDAPHPNAVLVKTSCWVNCSRDISEMDRKEGEATAYIVEHCNIDSAPPMNYAKFGNQYVSNLARNMVYDRASTDADWVPAFRRIVRREEV